MAAKDDEILSCIANSPAEFVWCPDNISGEITGPPWFDQHLAPYYDKAASRLHRAGKKLVAHMDGMMARLKEQVASTPLDVIEAFTPAPDTDLTLREAREAWPDKALWINYPSSVHLQPADRICEHTQQLLRQAAPGAGFAIGITENIPADVAERSLTAITETINRHGLCPLGA